MARIKYWDEASQSWKYADKSLKIDNSFLIDETLSVSGRAAEAKAVGDAINDTKAYAVEKATEAARIMKDDILNGAGAAYDTLKEVGVLIEENRDAIEALEAIAGSVKSVNGVAPDENGNVQIEVSSGADLTGYATEEWVQEGFQPKGEYLTAVPDGYAKIEDIPTKPEDIGAQPAGNYALKSEIPSVPVQSVNGKTGAVQLSASDVGARPSTWMPSASDVGALPSSTVIPTVPTKLSAFTNDSGFITGYTETDPTVPNWAKQTNKPTYTASEVGALPNTTQIPNALSDLEEDITHRVVTDAEKAAWNAKSNFSGNYNDLTNKPAIPSIEGLVKEQDFNKAIGDLTQDLQNISNYFTPQMYGAKADGITDDTEAINAAINAAGDGGTVFIPDGVYLVKETDATNKNDRIAIRIDNKKNFTLLLSNEAVIKHDTSPSPYYRTIRINNSESITIRGGCLIGELDTHTPETTESGDMVNTHGYGIRAIDSSNITIDNIELINYYGDPLIFCSELNPYQGCKNVTVTNCKIHDSARNGITVTSCQGLLIQNCEIYNINKAMPKAGIDIEGEYAGSINENIIIDNCNIHSNGRSSICAVLTCDNIYIKNSILGNAFTMSENATNIVISNCQTESIHMQSNLILENSTVKAISLGNSEIGNLIINCKIVADKTSRHHVDISQVNSKCQFINCEFIVPETFDNEYFYNFRNNSYSNHENQYSGDLSFENCVIQTKPIKLSPFAGGFKKVSLINCSVIGTVETTNNQWFGIGAKEIFIRNSIFDASQLNSSSFSSLIKLNSAKVFVEGTLIKTKENVIPTKVAFSQVLNSDESTFEKVYYINNILTAWTDIGSIPEEAGQHLIIGNIFADTLAEENINDLIIAIDNKLDANKLPEAINAALAQAKESGEFNGTSVTIRTISQTTESGEVSTVTFSDGKKLEIANGRDGANGYSGVYVGSSEPPINANVKIDPNGEGPVLIIPDVLQTVGDSEVDTMSQKAITELLNSIGGSGGSGSGEPARSIVSIKRTSGNGGAGSTDTYTITYTDGTTSTFTVYNGKDGTNGTNGKTAYESAKSGGYTGTEANFNTTLNNITKYSTETWTFILEDDSTVTKKVVTSS